ncbi:hypothetical protein LEP1GSC082_4341 [Leptospira kirschneri str. H2]|uniref:Uncharacterized protein n=1 Tax=Leptospira kirschneri str. H1 TaxID=1049966 RepID=A0A0E2B790_9LEPT|nr:hypothetical protein LEP1GSC081_2345 [Leptospira kirschneri str. H1]EKO62476.1 hypothetical protein LEP1GSC082_4341 [Leptospira kirschneri str. H2]
MYSVSVQLIVPFEKNELIFRTCSFKFLFLQQKFEKGLFFIFLKKINLNLKTF